MQDVLKGYPFLHLEHLGQCQDSSKAEGIYNTNNEHNSKAEATLASVSVRRHDVGKGQATVKY